MNHSFALGHVSMSRNGRMLDGKGWNSLRKQELIRHLVGFNLLALKNHRYRNTSKKYKSFQKSTPGYEKVIQFVPLSLQAPLVTISASEVLS